MDDQNQTNPTPDPMTPNPDQPVDGSQPQEGGNDQYQPTVPTEPVAPVSDMPTPEAPVTPDQNPTQEGDLGSDTNQGAGN